MDQNKLNLRKLGLYLFFAVITSGINIGSQWLIKIILKENIWMNSIKISGTKWTLVFFIQLATGTIFGFVVKFVLDKFIVFQENNTILTNTIKQLLLYGFFAVFTTLIFWSVEIAFKQLVTIKNSELLGGIIGLIIGYTIKFFLDKKYVFNQQ